MAEQETIILGIVGIENKGEYDSETEYEKLNVVTYQGSTYCALKNTIGNLPTDTDYWQLYAEKGDKGDTGDAGIPGPQGIPGEPGGSPLVATSTSEMTDTTSVYVNTTDGKWYYYDGDSWEIGGVYQTAGIADNSITIDKLATNIQEQVQFPDKLFDDDLTLISQDISGLTPNGRVAYEFAYRINLKQEDSRPYKIVFYGTSGYSCDYYFAEKNMSTGIYTIKTSKNTFTFGSDGTYTIYPNLDLSSYTNCFIIVKNCSYYSSGNIYGIERVNLSTGETSDVHNDWGVGVNIYSKKFVDYDHVLTEDNIHYVRTVNPTYIKNLKNVVTDNFTKINPDFWYVNSVIDSGLSCENYTLTRYNKSSALDDTRVCSKFIYQNVDTKLGMFIGNILGQIDTENLKITIHENYGQNNNPPAAVVTDDLTITFVNGREYMLEIDKNNKTFVFTITDLTTMVSNSITYSQLNKGLGKSGVVTFTGEILFTEFRLYTPLYNYAKVLFLGDSVTEGVGVTDPDNRYCYKLMTTYFSNDGIIAGVGGNTTAQGNARYDELKHMGYTFEYVIVYLGLNDMRLGNGLSTWETNITSLRNEIIADGFKPIICIPQLLGGDHTQDFEDARDFVLSNGWDCIRFDLTSITQLHPNDTEHNEMYNMAVKCLNSIM